MKSTATWRTVLRYALIIGIAAVAGAFIHAQLPRQHRPLLSDSDVMFAQMMTTHHQQALTIADSLAPDAAPELRALADQIKFVQQAEVGTMIGWLQLADQPLNPAVHSHDMAGMTAMPGMASGEELGHLAHAKGRDNEILFLQLMIRHHQGGIDMAAEQSRASTTEAVRRTTMMMVNEQLQDVVLMRRLLVDRHAAPLAYP